MPQTINDLITNLNLPSIMKVKWNESIPTEKEGIYIVSLSNSPDANNGILNKCPISESILKKWIKKVGGFQMDNKLTFNIEIISERLSQFWLSDENILYVGKAPKRKNGNGIGNRLREYYRTEFGENKPHAGGHWLKLLNNINELFVYYTTCQNSGDIELEILKRFCENVSKTTKKLLRDPLLPLPFANLEFKRGLRKNHGLKKMKI